MFRWLLLVLVGQSAAVDVDVEVQTATPPFTVRGETSGDVNIFYGIPFTIPRIPPHRFELPEDFVHAQGSIYNAQDQKHECVQSSGAGSEDCLYLDIYMPSSRSATNTDWPVLVWIHGGAWMTGSKNEYSGVLWASQNWTDDVDRAVVVTTNYRMNILGYPDYPGLHTNLGMHDNIHALRWVKNHIGNFNGDTNLITIYGESAGSMQVVQLWASPAARGLFHRAVAQSPYQWDYTQGTPVPDEATGTSKRARQATCLESAKAIACQSLPGGVNDASCSVQTPTLAQMNNVTECFGRWYGPMQEDGLISTTFHRDWCGHVDVGAGVPLLVGHNELEVNLWSLLGSYAGKESQMRGWVDYLAPLSNGTSIFQCLGDLYQASGRLQDPFMPPGRTGTQEHVYATSGVFFNMISQTLAQLPNVHLFLFNESADHIGYGLCNNPLGAHTCEVPFVITETAKYYANGTNRGFGAPMDTAVQRNMRRVWANFATTGNPGWAHDEVGVFMDNGIEIRASGDAFIPAASTLLTKLMCHPASIAPTCPMPETHTCADMKRLFRRNHCCGNPGRTFHF